MSSFYLQEYLRLFSEIEREVEGLEKNKDRVYRIEIFYSMEKQKNKGIAFNDPKQIKENSELDKIVHTYNPSDGEDSQRIWSNLTNFLLEELKKVRDGRLKQISYEMKKFEKELNKSE